MVTIELVRKRSEHNEGEIATLEELSLHQEDIEKIEHLQNWCRELRILLLQSNLIPKIENLNRMKRLEYLNLALNNIERIENLEGCESLEKLDLTLNFIGELTSVATLIRNINLHTLYLTGNPCAEFSGYRDYVIATLPQLQTLDSVPILRSDRIKAIQKFELISEIILKEQDDYKVKRETQREENLKKMQTTTNSVPPDDPEEMKKFWDDLCDNSPETRVELANLSRKQKEQERRNLGGNDDALPKRKVKLFKEDGQPLSVNEPRIPFTLFEDEASNSLVLTIEVYRHLDTSLIEADLQPTYARVTIKGKVFQIVLPEEIHSDNSSAKRSQTTGHLVITMPMVKEAQHKKTSLSSLQSGCTSINPPTVTNSKREFLEIGRADKSMDFSQIVNMPPTKVQDQCFLDRKYNATAAIEKPVSESFRENSEVPPLE